MHSKVVSDIFLNSLPFTNMRFLSPVYENQMRKIALLCYYIIYRNKHFFLCLENVYNVFLTELWHF